MKKTTKKNILFTLWYANGYHGGVMYVAEIGEYLNSIGWTVSCAAVDLTDEIRDFWNQKGINTYMINDLPTSNVNYDIVWHLHFPLLGYLILRGLKYSKIIYNSLSAFLELETPACFTTDLDLKLAVSKECRDSLVKRANLKEDDIIILNNMVPTEFFNFDKKISDKISKIAIVSNHPPKEILNTLNLFSQKNIVVDIFGEKYRHEPVTPELLSDYDVIITIGKTVQYSLALEIPCYNYDHFGGSGYITLENIDKEEYFNFSGRSYKTKKSSNEIVNDIISQYPKVLSQALQLKQIAMERYLLPLKINEVIALIKATPNTNIDINKHYLTLIQHKFIVEETLRRINEKNHLLHKFSTRFKTNTDREEYIESLENNINLLKNKERIYSKYYRYKVTNLLLFGKNRHYSIKYNEYKSYTRNLKKITNLKPKLTAVMCVKNEEYYLPGFLKHIEKYVDAIVAVDDGSTDNTVTILENHPKCEKVIKLPFHSSEDWDEVGNRKLVMDLAREINSDWVLCCDPDERFEENFLKNLRKLIKKNERICYHIKFREIWDNYMFYRCDGIWDKKEKGILFPLASKMTFVDNQNHHIPWAPKEIHKHINLNYNLYHFKMLKKEEREARKNLYNNLDPNKTMQKLGYDYLVDTKNIKLKKISLFNKYTIETIPKDLKNYTIK